MTLFTKMKEGEKKRYISMISSFNDTEKSLIQTLRSAILDLLTLKCPSCSIPVDPYPDACSAVMCLNCGQYYCNYCFSVFEDRAEAHTHVASHSISESPEGRDPFLPADVVAEGHRLYRTNKMEQCVQLGVTSPSFGLNGGREVCLALILCSPELLDMKIDPSQLWTKAVTILNRRKQISRNHSEASLSSGSRPSLKLNSPLDEEQGQEHSEVDQEDISIHHSSTELTPAPILQGNHQNISSLELSTESLLSSDNLPGLQLDFPDHTEDISYSVPPGTITSTSRQGAVQLSNALVSKNQQAISQILLSFKNEIDVDFIDPSHGIPLLSLAILSSQPSVCTRLLDLGAEPLIPNREGRSSMYICVEVGDVMVLEYILKLHSSIDLNAPVTREFQLYNLIHVAARYITILLIITYYYHHSYYS
jgi:hypothetical protein